MNKLIDDLIKKATTLCKNKNICHYQEIIIDEFQDTSKLRLEFISYVVKNADAKILNPQIRNEIEYNFKPCKVKSNKDPSYRTNKYTSGFESAIAKIIIATPVIK